MARRSNNASPEELTKVLSLLQKKPPQSTFYSMTSEQQIAEKEDLLTEMILLSARPTSSWVSTALKMVWQRSEQENIGRFAKALTFCSQYCFQKAFQSTTGAKPVLFSEGLSNCSIEVKCFDSVLVGGFCSDSCPVAVFTFQVNLNPPV